MFMVLHTPATGGVGTRDDGSNDYTCLFEDEKGQLFDMLTKGAIPMPKQDFLKGRTYETYALDGGTATPSPAAHVKKSGIEEVKVEVNNDDDGGGICITSTYFQEYEGLSLPTPDHPVQVSSSRLSFL